MLLLLQQVATYCAHAYPGIHLKSCPAHTLEIGLEQLPAVLYLWSFRDRMPFSMEAVRGGGGVNVMPWLGYTAAYKLPTPNNSSIQNWETFQVTLSEHREKFPSKLVFPKPRHFKYKTCFIWLLLGEAAVGGYWMGRDGKIYYLPISLQVLFLAEVSSQNWSSRRSFL